MVVILLPLWGFLPTKSYEIDPITNANFHDKKVIKRQFPLQALEILFQKNKSHLLFCFSFIFIDQLRTKKQFEKV